MKLQAAWPQIMSMPLQVTVGRQGVDAVALHLAGLPSLEGLTHVAHDDDAILTHMLTIVTNHARFIHILRL
jgi:hypothetical protein